MKKQYDAPVAEKVDFDYEENVTASGVPTNQATKCYNPCGQDTPKPPMNPPTHGGGGHYHYHCWFIFSWF